MFSGLFVCWLVGWFVCLSARSLKKLCADFDEIFRGVGVAQGRRTK